MVYVTTPLIFLILGYSLLYIALRPMVHLGVSYAGMFMSREAPDFAGNFTSIYDEGSFGKEDAASTIDRSDVKTPAIGTHYGEFSNERIGLKAPVYYGDTGRILNAGIGHYTGSFMPGFGRPIMMSAHNRTHFAPLEDAEVGDVFIFRTHYGEYQYEVREIAVYDHRDRSAYDLRQDKEELIIYTCYDFTPISGRKTDRIFLYMDKISGPEVH